MQINDWNEVKIVESTDANVLKYVFSKEDAVAKVEGGDGLPPRRQATLEEVQTVQASIGEVTIGQVRVIGASWAYRALQRESELQSALNEIERLKGLLREVDLMICDHVSCDVVMEGPRPYLRKKQELANKLHSLGIKIAAVTGE